MKVIVTDFSELGFESIPDFLVQHLKSRFPLETILVDELIDIMGTLSHESFYLYDVIEE